MSQKPLQAILVVPGDINNLSPNKRLCWQQSGPMKGRWRKAACAAAEGLNWPRVPRKVRLDWVVRRSRALDAANVHGSGALKACEDGLVDAGIVPDDTLQYVEWGIVRQETGAEWKQKPELQVTITVLEGE